MSEIAMNNFEIRLVASAENVPDLFLEHLSKAAVSWADEPIEDDTEDEDEDHGFLVPDEDTDEDSDESDDEDEDEVQDEGRISIQIKLTAEAFLEYRQMRDADPEYMITATIIYKDGNNTPIFHHEYECYEGMYLTHDGGDKQNSETLLLELSGRYQDCIQFAVFTPPNSTVMQ